VGVQRRTAGKGDRGVGIPVVSAVGHERDHSISDFVADYAAATPTAAAEFLVRGKAELGERLETIEKRMAGVMQLRVANLHRRYERASSCPMLSHPEDYVNRLSQQVDYLGARLLSALPGLATARRQRLDYLESRLLQALPGLATARRQRLDYAESRLLQVLPSLATTRRQRLDAAAERLPQAMERQMAEWTHRLERIAVGMTALNPKSVLTRGYSILLDGGGHAVRRADETFEGAKLHALLGEGELDVAVESVKEARG
jgi:exodeoxyribonuclease VII large subunit